MEGDGWLGTAPDGPAVVVEPWWTGLLALTTSDVTIVEEQGVLAALTAAPGSTGTNVTGGATSIHSCVSSCADGERGRAT